MRDWAIGFCLGVLVAGCAVGPELTPAPGANQVAGQEDTAELVDARNGEHFGTLRIPLVMREG